MTERQMVLHLENKTSGNDAFKAAAHLTPALIRVTSVTANTTMTPNNIVHVSFGVNP